MFVKEVMKLSVKKITSESTVLDAARKMAQSNIGCLVVFDDRLLGIITERDILNKVVAEGKEPDKVRVRDVMTRNVITITADKDMEEASDLMARYRIKRLPVVFGNDVIGIITSTDVVAVLSKVVKEIYSQQ